MRRAPFILRDLFFDVPPKKRGNLRSGKGRKRRQALVLVAL